MPDTHDPRPPLTDLAKRAAVVAGTVLVVAGLAVFVWTVSQALLVFFAAVLFAVMLDGLAGLLMRLVRMPRALALTLVVLIITACIGGILVGGTAKIAGQAPQLRRSMEQSIQRIESRISHMDLGVDIGKLKSKATQGGQAGNGKSTFIKQVRGYLSSSFEAGAEVLITIIAGIYFAAHPRFYIDTPVKLVPQHRRKRLREALRVAGHALRRWLIGRFASMLAVGLIAGIGLAALHVQMVILLAVIACVMTFIPYLGTIISLIPAVLVAIMSGPLVALYVVLLYLGAHALEGYVLAPLIQSRTVHLAPGWLILSQLVGGLVAGIFGILIAAPVLVALAVMVQLLYVEDVLGDNVQVLGQ